MSPADLTASAALDSLIAFATVPFRVSRGPESDGLLYQYGTYTFTGEPRFHLDLTMQFAVAGEDEYLQFHCDVQFAPTRDLTELGQHSEWWFADVGLLEEWASSVRARPEWPVLDALTPFTVQVSLDGT